MKRHIAVIGTFIALVYLLFAPYLAWPAEYHWSQVRKGGKEMNKTYAAGTNDAGWIAGNWYGYADPNQPGGAFRFKDGKFIAFAAPGATSTEVADIESSSTIVGNYRVPDGQGGEQLHAFLYKHGLNQFDVIDVPGAFWTNMATASLTSVRNEADRVDTAGVRHLRDD